MVPKHRRSSRKGRLVWQCAGMPLESRGLRRAAHTGAPRSPEADLCCHGPAPLRLSPPSICPAPPPLPARRFSRVGGLTSASLATTGLASGYSLGGAASRMSSRRASNASGTDFSDNELSRAGSRRCGGERGVGWAAAALAPAWRKSPKGLRAQQQGPSGGRGRRARAPRPSCGSSAHVGSLQPPARTVRLQLSPAAARCLHYTPDHILLIAAHTHLCRPRSPSRRGHGRGASGPRGAAVRELQESYQAAIARQNQLEETVAELEVGEQGWRRQRGLWRGKRGRAARASR